jgi:hypothetical protein
MSTSKTRVYVLRGKADPTRYLQKPWIVIVEPDADAKLLVVMTVYEVSND